MNGEPIKTLRLSSDPSRDCDGAIADAAVVIETFLDQLDEVEEGEILKQIVSGQSLRTIYDEEPARELAAYRLARLLPHIGRAASELADIDVFDVVTEGEDTTTARELEKLTSVNT